MKRGQEFEHGQKREEKSAWRMRPGLRTACRERNKKNAGKAGNAVQLRLFYVPNVVALGPGFDHTGA
ncbi:hypothetical protein, partial [Burkholderia stagnalis]|uniref:hypothetical protein n=1 Tax=Burkholderia stagnalis TaxID=1503054 RepID=UPI001C8A8D4F